MSRWLFFLTMCCVACGGSSGNAVSEADRSPAPWRELVIWVQDPVDEELVVRMHQVGVDRVIVRRGTIDVRSGNPVLKMEGSVAVPDAMDVGHWYFVNAGLAQLNEDLGAAVWNAVGSNLDRLPTEVLLEFSKVPEGAGGFIRRLRQQSGLPVALVLPEDELRSPAALQAAEASSCVVTALFGANDRDLRGMESDRVEPIAERLSVLADREIPVRVAIGLRPTVSPPLSTWGEDLNLLTETGNATVSTATEFHRRFVTTRSLRWSGRDLASGSVIDAKWMDVARLDSAFRQVDRLIMPRVLGWDLVPLPPAGDSVLGISRNALFSYLEGSGPAPDLAVNVERQGRSIWVTLENRSSFGTAVSSFGNQVEVRIDQGQLVAEDRGTFDKVALGTVVRGRWESAIAGEVNGVRFVENYIGPGERLKTGSVRLPSSRSHYVVNWHIVLSTGQELESQAIGR